MLNIMVYPPTVVGGHAKQKNIKWPALPTKGQTINLGLQEYAGVDVVVDDVIHWFGSGIIQIDCSISKQHTYHAEVFGALTRKSGWI